MRNLVLSPSRFVAITVAAAAVVVLTQCKKSVTAPAQVAAANATVPIKTTTVAAAQGIVFNFPNGGGAISSALNNQTITVTFSNTSAASPTTTVAVPGGGQFVASTTFGSCIFTVTSSTLTGISVGQVITVNPCQLNVATGGVKATGQATNVQIALQLGLVPSAAQQSQVAINPSTGVVTVNGVNTGQTVTLRPATGG